MRIKYCLNGVCPVNYSKYLGCRAGFMLTNRLGGYCYLSDHPETRYQGVFFREQSSPFRMFKIIETIRLTNNDLYQEVSQIKNALAFVTRTRKGTVRDLTETFFMPQGYNSLFYDIDNEEEIELVLDVRESYYPPQYGRHYEHWVHEDGRIIVKYTQDNAFTAFLVIDAGCTKEQIAAHIAMPSPDSKPCPVQFTDNWYQQYYHMDRERNSMPDHLYVYSFIKAKTSKLVMTFGTDLNKALEENSFVREHREFLLEAQKRETRRVISQTQKLFPKLFHAGIIVANAPSAAAASVSCSIVGGVRKCVNLKEDTATASKKGKSRRSSGKDSPGQTTLSNIAPAHVSPLPNGAPVKMSGFDEELGVAYACALNSLRSLIVTPSDVPEQQFLKSELSEGMYAGLPWFFQYWHRDEAISLQALSRVEGREFCRRFLLRAFQQLQGKKMSAKHGESGVLSADAALWVVKRGCEMESELAASQAVQEFFANEEMSYIISSAHETWMDSLSRDGACIELQALKLSLLKLSGRKKEEREFRERVRKDFWDSKKKLLADRLSISGDGRITPDFTVRPNIFIAAYAYPELLTVAEWKSCFDKIIPKLWLEWGGFSTIDTDADSFVDQHTGEDGKSYHNGDSWYFLNSMAALALARIDKKAYSSEINAIVRSSVNEILWGAASGHASELSSADVQRSQGCAAQAWSAAMFVELVEELRKSVKSK